MLVGRESELQALDALMAGARVGDSRALVLSGEPGIGKTTLLTEAERLVGDMTVLRGRGVETEQLVPFAGLLQVLRPLLGLLDEIPDPQARAVSAALLLDASAPGEPSRFAVGAATLSLLARAAEDRPLAVLVDDGHLLDTASTEALVFAARRLISDTVAIIVAVRAGEPGAARWAPLPTMTLTGLGLDAVRELVTATYGPLREDHVARLQRATAGNPLALLELGDHLDLRGRPPGAPVTISEQLSRAFIGRVQHLGTPARTALLVAAADSVSVSTVLRACATLGVVDPSLAEAADTGLVSLLGDRIEFRHPLVRSAVYGAADAGTRRAVHRALAEVIPADQSDRLAWHLSESAAGPDEPTAALLTRTAAQASTRGAHSIAASAHERAADLTVAPSLRAERLAAAGEAAWLAGSTSRAVDLLDRALESSTGPRLRARIREVRGAVETRCGSLDAALSTVLGAAEEVRDADAGTAIRLYSDAIHVAFYLGDPAAAMRACAVIDELSGQDVDPGTRALGSMASGMALVLGGSGAEGIERLRGSAYALMDPHGLVVDKFRIPLRVQGALWLRDAGPHRALVAAAIDRLREEAALGSLPYLLMHIARDAATTDRWDDAEAAYTEAIRLAGETGQTTDLAVSQAGLAVLHARRGQVAECRADVEAAGDLCRQNHIRLGTFWLELAQGDLCSGLDDMVGAAEHYESLERQLAEAGLTDPDLSCAPELVETYVHQGRTSEASTCAAGYAVKARAKGQPWSTARGERASALCGPEAEAHFRAALELHAQTPDRYETARTELALGAWLRRERRRTEAREPLRAALAGFEELGAAPWVDRALRELRATGETVHRRRVDAIADLTPQERQIAQLLAEGRTTREAAAALFLSPKTVEYHLRHVYQKLDLRSRAALAERLGARGRPAKVGGATH